MKLDKIRPRRLNRNHKFLLKAGIYFVITYAITVEFLILALNYIM